MSNTEESISKHVVKERDVPRAFLNNSENLGRSGFVEAKFVPAFFKNSEVKKNLSQIRTNEPQPTDHRTNHPWNYSEMELGLDCCKV